MVLLDDLKTTHIYCIHDFVISGNATLGPWKLGCFAPAKALLIYFRLIRRDNGLFNAITFSGQRSAANSAGLLAWPSSHFDWVRPGYMLYGLDPMVGGVETNLHTAMNFVSRVTALRDVAAGDAVGYGGTWVARKPSRIATVTCGYGDGYPRQARNGTPALVRGQRAALAGRVSMDMLTLDVTDIEGVELGDDVLLWGEDLPVSEIAAWSGTIGYELTTRMPARVPRTAAVD